MNDQLFKKDCWHLLIIDDQNFLPGKSIYDVLQLLANVIKFNFVILNDINGANISSLIEKENTVTSLEEILNAICEVKQFDWGDFFLFKDYPINWQTFGNINDYPKLIAQTDTTVRAVDDQYIYVYTPYQEIVEVLKENYVIESIKKDLLNNLDYPY